MAMKIMSCVALLLTLALVAGGKALIWANRLKPSDPAAASPQPRDQTEFNGAPALRLSQQPEDSPATFRPQRSEPPESQLDADRELFILPHYFKPPAKEPNAADPVATRDKNGLGR
jgi:hypothetical protein